MPILVWALRILLFLFFFGFALLNTDRVTVDLFFTRWHAPLALVLLAFFVVGALIGVALLLPRFLGPRPAPLPPPRESVPPQAGEPPRLV